MNKHLLQLPLKAIEDFVNFKKSMIFITENLPEFIHNYTNNDYPYFLRNSTNSAFYFTITFPHFDETTKHTYYEITFAPFNRTSIQSKSHSVAANEVMTFLELWITLVKAYELGVQKINDPFLEQAEEELFQDFHLDDDDASTATLNNEKQAALYKLISMIENKVEEEHLDIDSQNKLLDYSKQLKEDLSKLPKVVVASRLKKWMSKIRKTSKKLFYDLIDVGYKESLKFALKAGSAEVQTLIEHLSHHR